MFRRFTMAIFRLYMKYLAVIRDLLWIVQPEDNHCQAPKHVVVPYVINTIYTFTIKQSRVRQVHTLHSS